MPYISKCLHVLQKVVANKWLHETKDNLGTVNVIIRKHGHSIVFSTEPIFCENPKSNNPSEKSHKPFVEGTRAMLTSLYKNASSLQQSILTTSMLDWFP